MFAGSAYLGVVLGYFASYGAAIHISNSTQLQWFVEDAKVHQVAA